MMRSVPMAVAALIAGLTMAAAATAAPRPAAYVRVDQVGYASAAPKRAYVLSNVRESNEPAIDLTAGSPLAFSWQIASGGA